MNSDHYAYAIEQLAENHGSWPDIARQCEVSYSWLCKLAKNKIPNASHARVKRLAEHLERLSKARRVALAKSRALEPTKEAA